MATRASQIQVGSISGRRTARCKPRRITLSGEAVNILERLKAKVPLKAREGKQCFNQLVISKALGLLDEVSPAGLNRDLEPVDC